LGKGLKKPLREEVENNATEEGGNRGNKRGGRVRCSEGVREKKKLEVLYSIQTNREGKSKEGPKRKDGSK